MRKSSYRYVPLAFAASLAASALLADPPPRDQVVTGRQEEGIAACPPEFALGGLDTAVERLWCRYLGAKPAASQIVRSPGRRAGRRVLLLCPGGWYLRGFSKAAGNILCSYSHGLQPRGEISTEGAPQPGGVRACPGDAASPGQLRVMTGIQDDGRELFCGLVEAPRS